LTAHTPWWIPPFLGRAPALEPRLLRLLGLVALALFFEQYDMSMLTSALKFIAADLGIAEADLGGYLGAIRLGALPAFLVVPFADRIGRRRVFLACVVGVSLGTFLTAFARGPVDFVVLQMLTRGFILAGSAVAVVIVTEEFPAEHRGWGIGMLGALGSCGHGLGAALFAAIDVLPYGWRALYAIGLCPLLLLPFFRRGIEETGRFTRAVGSAHGLSGHGVGWYRPLIGLARTYPGRAAALALSGGLVAIGEAAVFQFPGYFTQTVHGWSPGQFSAMVILGGGVGIIGHVVAGRLGDRIGRRTVGAIFFGLFPFFAWTFYQGPGGWSIPIAWVLFVFCGTAGDVIVRALSTELFPTSHRGTAAGWLTLVQTLSWAAGLGLVGLGTDAPGDIARMTSLLSATVLVGGLALLLLPETRRRELETISAEYRPETSSRGA
jgi:putative MFS transporter